MQKKNNECIIFNTVRPVFQYHAIGSTRNSCLELQKRLSLIVYFGGNDYHDDDERDRIFRNTFYILWIHCSLEKNSVALGNDDLMKTTWEIEVCTKSQQRDFFFFWYDSKKMKFESEHTHQQMKLNLKTQMTVWRIARIRCNSILLFVKSMAT